MSNAWFQESSDWKLRHDGAYFHELIVGSLFSFRHFRAEVNGNIFCSRSGFRDKTLYING